MKESLCFHPPLFSMTEVPSRFLTLWSSYKTYFIKYALKTNLEMSKLRIRSPYETIVVAWTRVKQHFHIGLAIFTKWFTLVLVLLYLASVSTVLVPSSPRVSYLALKAHTYDGGQSPYLGSYLSLGTNKRKERKTSPIAVERVFSGQVGVWEEQVSVYILGQGHERPASRAGLALAWWRCTDRCRQWGGFCGDRSGGHSSIPPKGISCVLGMSPSPWTSSNLRSCKATGGLQVEGWAQWCHRLDSRSSIGMVPTGTDDLINSAWLWPYGEKRAIRGREERDGAGLLEEERVRVEIIGKDRWSKVIMCVYPSPTCNHGKNMWPNMQFTL